MNLNKLRSDTFSSLLGRHSCVRYDWQLYVFAEFEVSCSVTISFNHETKVKPSYLFLKALFYMLCMVSWKSPSLLWCTFVLYGWYQQSTSLTNDIKEFLTAAKINLLTQDIFWMCIIIGQVYVVIGLTHTKQNCVNYVEI